MERIFKVNSGTTPDKTYEVRVGEGCTCTCKDSICRKHTCKHIKKILSRVFGISEFLIGIGAWVEGE